MVPWKPKVSSPPEQCLLLSGAGTLWIPAEHFPPHGKHQNSLAGIPGSHWDVPWCPPHKPSKGHRFRVLLQPAQWQALSQGGVCSAALPTAGAKEGKVFKGKSSCRPARSGIREHQGTAKAATSAENGLGKNPAQQPSALLPGRDSKVWG